MDIQLKAYTVIDLCAAKIEKIEATRQPQLDNLFARLRDQTITTGILWWKTSRKRTEEEVQKLAHYVEEPCYTGGPMWIYDESLVDEINNGIERRTKKIKAISGIATTALAFGSEYVTLNDDELRSIS